MFDLGKPECTVYYWKRCDVYLKLLSATQDHETEVTNQQQPPFSILMVYMYNIVYVYGYFHMEERRTTDLADEPVGFIGDFPVYYKHFKTFEHPNWLSTEVTVLC